MTITREFTKAQLIAQARENVKDWQRVQGAPGSAEYVAIRLRIAEIALAALTTPDCPPKDTGAVGRSMDASYRRQGAVTGWAACLHRILKGLE
ncbi:hypothetical protein WIB65_12160 [Citrobacter freundii]|uniref:hypothetical protein n=1 Tax=Citrobacter freundii TaxID=546 RepID=UPI00339BF098